MLFDKYYNLLSEGVDEYIDGIDSLDDLHKYAKEQNTFVYSRTWKKNIPGIQNDGTSREYIGSNGAHAYGFGLYCTTTLIGEQRGMGTYGDVIVKLIIPGFDRCIIQNNCRSDFIKGNLAQVVHGGKSFKDQIFDLVSDPKDAQKLYNNPTGSNSAVEEIYHEYNIDGIILDNGLDWAVWKDFKRIVPYEYSLDNGRTWKPLANQRTIDITVKSWEPDVAFGKEFNKYFLTVGGKRVKAGELRCSNGYFTVQTEKGYNIVDPRTKKRTSPIWFDLCSDVQNNGVAEIRYNGNRLYYEPSTNYIYDSDDDWKIECEDAICTVEDLPTMFGDKVAESIHLNGNIINEEINEYVPDIDRDSITYEPNSNKFVYFYRLAHKEQTESIIRNGFSKEFRGTGNDNTDWVGSGTYGNLVPRSHPSHSYGEVVWCYATPASIVSNGYITPNQDLAHKYNIPGTYAEQLERFFPEHCKKWKQNGLFNELIDSRGYSGSQMLCRLNNALVGKPLYYNSHGGVADHVLHEAGVKGYLYRGNIDGASVLTTDDGTIIPVSYKRIDINDDWHKVDISDQLWNRTYNYYDPLAFLGGSYKDYDGLLGNTTNDNDQKQAIINGYRVSNGYMLVRRKKDGKYNLVKAPEGRNNFASPIWFDLCSDVSDNGVAEIRYNGNRYFYEPSTNYIYEEGDGLDVRIECEDALCTIEDLPNL